MICPQCEANDSARISMIYMQGTHSFSSSATSMGSYVPGVGCVSANAYGHTTASTALAQSFAPPVRPELIRALGRAVISAVVLTVITVNVAIAWLQMLPIILAPLVLVPGLLAACFFIRRYIRARRNFTHGIKEWGATWCCFRCGHLWIPEANVSLEKSDADDLCDLAKR
jgi:hypothetical protein